MIASRYVHAILIAGSVASATVPSIASAETWVIAKADGTCMNAEDIADQTGDPAFASPFKVAHLGAKLKIDRNKYSGEISVVTVKPGDNKNLVYFPNFEACVSAQRSVRH